MFYWAETLYPIIMNNHINYFIGVNPEINSVLVMNLIVLFLLYIIILFSLYYLG